MISWVTACLRHPRLTLAIVAVVTLVAVMQCLGLRTDNAIEAWLPTGDSELARYVQFRELFGEDNFVIVAVDGPAASEELGDELAAVLAGVGDVLGPEGDPGRPWLDTSMLRSVDRGSTAWIVSPRAGMEAAPFVRAVREALSQTALRADAVLAGPLAVNEALDEASQASFSGLFPVVLLLLGGVLWVTLRSVVLVLAVLLVSAVATSWTLGLLAATGHTLNMVVAPLPALLLVLGTAYALHLLCAARARTADDEPARWRRAMAEVLRPSVVTALTTASGLAALTLAELPPVRQLGAFGAFGVLSTVALVFTLLPALFLVGRRGLGPAWGAPAAATLWLGGVMRYRRRVMVAASVVAIVAGVGASRLVMASDVLSYFPDDHPLPVATRVIERDLTGLTPLEIRVSGEADLILAADTVDSLRGALDACLELPAVTGVFGPIVSDQRTAALPSAVVAPLLRQLHDAGELATLGGDRVHVDGSHLDLRWTVASQTTSIEESAALIERVRHELLGRLPDGLVTHLTGAVALLVRVQALLLTTQVKTFGVSLLAVTAVLALAFRSWRLAALSLVPNLLPVLMTLGTMGFLGIPLNVATVMVAGIAYGLVVDDTVHILSRVAQGAESGRPTMQRMADALAVTARPVVATSIATAVGFSAFALASFRPTVWFGLLIGVTALYALVCDLIVLPVLMARRA